MNIPCKDKPDDFGTIAPPISCAFNCEGCAFNPDERDRRVREGYFVDYKKDGKMLKRLHFRSYRKEG